MDIIRQTTIYPHSVRLEARDQYNDYSVRADHTLIVRYGDGKAQSFELGTNQSKAICRYNDAVALIYAHASIEAEIRQGRSGDSMRAAKDYLVNGESAR